MFGGPAGQQALPFPGSIWRARCYYPLQRKRFWSVYHRDDSRNHHHCISVLTCSLYQQVSWLLAENESILKRLVIIELRFWNAFCKSDHVSFLFTPNLCCSTWLHRTGGNLSDSTWIISSKLPSIQMISEFSTLKSFQAPLKVWVVVLIYGLVKTTSCRLARQ